MGEEIWKDVPDYEGLYQISNLGRVKSSDRLINAKCNSKSFKKGRILRCWSSRDGYIYCDLVKENKQKHFRVHSLVGLAFIENKNPLIFNQINHIDGKKHNNFAENLEWCNAKHNTNESIRIGLRVGVRGKKNGIKRKIIQLSRNEEVISYWDSIIDASVNTRTNRSSILKCLKNIRNTAGGFVWKYNK